jgi:hypothetical protein
MNPVSFYRPEFLGGLLFLGAVLLIHLLRRPTTRVLDFSTLRFFRSAAVTATRMQRLRKWLLLAARLSAVAMVVALFAQPFDRRNPFSLLHDPHLTVFTWIDRTPSMDYVEASGVSLLSRACALVDSLRSRLPPSVRYFLYDEPQGDFILYDPLKPLHERTRHGPPRLDRVLRAWNENRTGCSLPLLVLLSDFQKPTSASFDTLLRRLAAKGLQRIMCVTLSPHPAWNYSVRNAVCHDAGKVSATLSAQGKGLDSAELTVTLSSVGAFRKSVSLPAGDTAAVTTVVVGNTGEASGGKAMLNARDPLSFDNSTYFVPRNSGAPRIVIVGDRERNFPVAAALASSQKQQRSSITTEDVGTVTFDDIDSADVVIINAANRTSRPLEALFTGQAFLNKTVLLSLDDNEQGFSAGTALIARVNHDAGPLRLAADTAPASIILPDTVSELWQGFPELRTQEAAIYRYGTGLPGTVLARLDNGTPLATCFADRNRTLIFVATPLGVTDANNLCETGFYVAFLDRLIRYAADKNRVPPDVWIAGFERRNPFYGSGRGALVLNDGGKVLERWQVQPSVLFKQPGLYKIVPDGEKAFGIAVNADPEESSLKYSLPVIPDEIMDNVLMLNEKQLIDKLRGRRNFLSYLPLLFLLLLLLAEVVLWENPRRRIL